MSVTCGLVHNAINLDRARVVIRSVAATKTFELDWATRIATQTLAILAYFAFGVIQKSANRIFLTSLGTPIAMKKLADSSAILW